MQRAKRYSGQPPLFDHLDIPMRGGTIWDESSLGGLFAGECPRQTASQQQPARTNAGQLAWAAGMAALQALAVDSSSATGGEYDL